MWSSEYGREERKWFGNFNSDFSDSKENFSVLLWSKVFIYLGFQSFQTLEFEMDLTSSVATILVVDIKDKARPIFKKHPFQLVEDDPEGAFSSVPYNILHNKDIRT